MKSIPLLSIILGICAPLPLIFLTLVILVFPLNASIPSSVSLAFVGYASMILTFIGGIQWGVAMQQPIILPSRRTSSTDNWRLFLGIFPGFFGWIALILTVKQHTLVALALLILSFIIVLFFERKAYLKGETPSGYLALRWITTAMIEVCLCTIFLLRL